jgi:hypothetical protein
MLERPDSASTRTLLQEVRRNGEVVGKAGRKGAARNFGEIVAAHLQEYPDRRRYPAEGAGLGDYGRTLAGPNEEGQRAAFTGPVTRFKIV